MNGEWCSNHQTYHLSHIWPMTEWEHELLRIANLRRIYFMAPFRMGSAAVRKLIKDSLGDSS